MLSYKNLFLLFILIHSPMAFSANHLMLIGGGGDPKGDETIFDSGLTSFAQNLKNSNWNYSVSFNGGHKITESIIKTQYNLSQSSTPFTKDSYKKMISEYKAKILLGEISSKDQLMIIVNTHGAIQDNNENTHKISVNGAEAKDLNKLTGSDTVSLDDLKELTNLADANHIKLGIIDLSCHSGATQKLKSPYTCVVSASSPKHFAYTGSITFIEKFFQSLKPGETLEEAYLKARSDSGDSSYPMISTGEHAKLENMLFSELTPYLYYKDKKSNKLFDYLNEQQSDPLLQCLRESQFQSLLKKIGMIEKTIPGLSTSKLKELLATYKRDQDTIVKKIQALNGNAFNKEETFTIGTNYPGLKSKVQTLTWREILSRTSINKTLEGKKAMLLFAKGQEKLEIQAEVEYLQEVEAKRQKILVENPKLKNYEAQLATVKNGITDNMNMAQDIATEERKLYDSYYQSIKTKNSNDPCKNITF